MRIFRPLSVSAIHISIGILFGFGILAVSRAEVVRYGSGRSRQLHSRSGGISSGDARERRGGGVVLLAAVVGTEGQLFQRVVQILTS